MSNPFGRIGLLGATVHPVKRQSGTCNLAAGELYTAPAANAAIDATKPITFKWNTACTMSSDKVDLYLNEPNAGVIKGFGGIDFAAGQYEVQLRPKWWNSTETAHLLLNIVPAGGQPWETVPGPVFQVTYPASAMYTTVTEGGAIKTNTAAAAATQSADGIFDNVASTKSSGISKGGIAAAVVVPILVIILALGVAIRFWRQRETEKRKRWSQALSTHSAGLEWEKGAHPGEKPPSVLGGAPRASMASQRTRPMSYATSSIYAVENNMAGTGAAFARPAYGARTHSSDNVSRSSVVLPDGNVRQSRISFAENTRPDRRSRLSLGGDIRPNVVSSPQSVFANHAASQSTTALELATPSKKSSYATGSALADEEEEMRISPSQLTGPGHFGDNELRKASGSRRNGRKSIMSLGGSDKRRESTASALSADDFKTAASARGSVDELRDLEGLIMNRRSMMSQHSSARSPAIDSQYAPDHMEALDNDDAYDMPAQPSPIAGAQTVAYGPDQMLAVYAARGKVNSSAMPPPSAPGSGPIPPPRPTAKRLLSNLTKRNDDNTAPVPQSGEMRSFVHLNNGTASSAAVEALPAPGPQSGLKPPMGRGRSNTVARHSDASQVSTYSEDNVGNAQ